MFWIRIVRCVKALHFIRFLPANICVCWHGKLLASTLKLRWSNFPHILLLRWHPSLYRLPLTCKEMMCVLSIPQSLKVCVRHLCGLRLLVLLELLYELLLQGWIFFSINRACIWKQSESSLLRVCSIIILKPFTLGTFFIVLTWFVEDLLVVLWDVGCAVGFHWMLYLCVKVVVHILSTFLRV